MKTKSKFILKRLVTIMFIVTLIVTMMPFITTQNGVVSATVKDDKGTWLWPVKTSKSSVPKDSITTYFGWDDYFGRWHKALDISSRYGTTIQSTRAGTVYKVQKSNTLALGNYIVIKHKGSDGNTYYSHYAHLSSISVKKGDTVKMGGKIGIMGTTGDSTGVHLHFQITKNNSGKHYGSADGNPSALNVVNNNPTSIKYTMVSTCIHSFSSTTGKCTKSGCGIAYLGSDAEKKTLISL